LLALLIKATGGAISFGTVTDGVLSALRKANMWQIVPEIDPFTITSKICFGCITTNPQLEIENTGTFRCYACKSDRVVTFRSQSHRVYNKFRQTVPKKDTFCCIDDRAIRTAGSVIPITDTLRICSEHINQLPWILFSSRPEEDINFVRTLVTNKSRRTKKFV